MKSLIPLALAMILFPGLLIAQEKSYDNSPIPSLDLGRFLGVWYEIARFDHSFERDMDNVVAEYLLRDDGKVTVINSGWKNGRYKVADGKARQPDPDTDPAHLEVSFFLSFYSDYNILMLDDNYQVALIGSGSPKYLWILSRVPVPKDAVIDEAIEEAEDRGYDTSKLIWVDQSLNAAIPL
jgi:lipocalin